MSRVFAWLVLTAVGLSQAVADTRPQGTPSSAPRIVSLAPALTELAYAAGAGDRLVAAVAYSDYPEAARELPRIGDAFHVDYERLAELQPDRILAWEGGNPASMLERLESLGYTVDRFSPRTLEDVAEHLTRIGRIAGSDDVAGRVAANYLAGLGRLRSDFSGLATVSVFYQISFWPLYTVGGDHYISQMIDLCGGRNVFEDLEVLAAVVDLEAVLAREPQLILGGALEEEELRGQWRQWPLLRAVRDDNLAVVDPDLTARASVRLLEGARAICRAVDRVRRKP